MIVGALDEVGWGSVAGPLVICVATFELDTMDPMPACPVAGVKDSKKFKTRKRREEVEASLRTLPNLSFHLGVVTADEINNWKSSRVMKWAWQTAAKRAIEGLPKKPDVLLVDGERRVRDWDGKQLVHVKADSLWWPVSAASILAKVQRDNWMTDLDVVYNHTYGWDQNAGYGTPAHKQAVIEHGLTPQHRLEYVKNWLSSVVQQDRASANPGA